MAARNIRTWKDVETAREAGAISEAEEKLIDGCQTGLGCDLGEDVPMTPSKERNIGADLLRYLITGGCDKAGLHEMGVQLRGAYIADQLDLDMCRAVGKTTLRHCYFAERLDAEGTEFQLLSLVKSHFPKGIRAQGAKVKSTVFLRGITAQATVDLNSAEIDGQLSCENAQLLCEEGKALDAQGTKIKGSVFLTKITAKATVDLNSAEIGGQLSCENAQLLCEEGKALNAQGAKIKADVFLRGITSKATVDLNSAEIGGQLAFSNASLEPKKGDALFLQGISAGSLFWTEIAACDGLVVLTSARVDDLVDDTESWAKISAVYLDRFSYGHLNYPLTIEDRLGWLAIDTKTAGVFRPQPYQQLAKVYREMGHDADRRRVLMEKERLTDVQALENHEAALTNARDALAKADDHYERLDIKNRIRRLHMNRLLRGVARGAHRHFVGYSYAPQWVLVWALAAITCIFLLSSLAMEVGGMVPNSDIVMVSAEWLPVANEDNPTAAWLETTAGRHYETFNAFAYAADVVIPLVPLEQETAWAPTTKNGWGTGLWVSNWLAKLFGWVLTGLGAAALTGHIRRE